MTDNVIHGCAIVMAIVYIAIGGTLLLSAAIVWLSRKLREEPYSLEPTEEGRRLMEDRLRYDYRGMRR